MFCLYLRTGSSCSHACTQVYITENTNENKYGLTTNIYHPPIAPGSLLMLASESHPSFSAFIPTSQSSPQDLPPLGDDEELWEIFLTLVLNHKAKLNENLGNTLNNSLLFVSSSLLKCSLLTVFLNIPTMNSFQATLFSAVNVGILALSLPTLNTGQSNHINNARRLIG